MIYKGLTADFFIRYVYTSESAVKWSLIKKLESHKQIYTICQYQSTMNLIRGASIRRKKYINVSEQFYVNLFSDLHKRQI